MGKLTEEQKIEIIKLYISGKNGTELGKLFGIDQGNILALLRRRGVNMRSQSQATRTYSIDENIFDKIDAPEKAYWLGFLMADGSICGKTSSLRLEISNKDISHIKKLLKFMKTNRPIYKRVKSCCAICIGNKHLTKSFSKYGIVPNKTMKIKTPNILSRYIKDFYRGFMDGDGWITHRNMRAYKRDKNGTKKYYYTGNIGTEIGFCSGSKKILIEIKKWINKHLDKEYGYMTHRKYKEGGEVWQLTFGGNRLCKYIYDLLYYDGAMCLSRKRDKLKMLLAFSDKITLNKTGKFSLLRPKIDIVEEKE